jgi:hypothetical protein
MAIRSRHCRADSSRPDWSVRIGIFGKWGEGKSTVLRFVETMQNGTGNIVFWFNPWAIQSLNDLWIDFGTKLFQSLDNAGLLVENPVKRSFRRLNNWLRGRGLYEFGEGAADILGRSKLYSGAFGLIGSWLKPDGAQVRKIRERLRGRRIIVLIDDLDRTSPELLPKLLLSLRELLDLPGFTFLLAFDDEIVGKALKEANKAWGEGGSFLDKVLDFRYHLPPVSKEGRRRLLARFLAQQCPFVPEGSTSEVEDLLPVNPRKLKSLIRSLATLKQQVSRHSPDELNWVDIWLGELVRNESESFFDFLLHDGILEAEAGDGYRIRWDLSSKGIKEKEEAERKGIESLLSRAGITDAQQTESLVRLLKATRSRSSQHLRYCWELGVRPHAITWKEFGELRGDWILDQRADLLSTWSARHAQLRSCSIVDVEDELFQSILLERDRQVSLAAETSTAEEHGQRCSEAQLLYQMMEQFLRQQGRFTPSRFEALYGKAFYWIGFRVNPFDIELRQQERTLLLSLLESSGDEMSTAFLEVMKPWERSYLPQLDEPGVRELKRSLFQDCSQILRPKAQQQLIDFLEQPRSCVQ